MALILGTAQFGLDYGITNQKGQIPFLQVCKILEEAKKSNINKLDTAVQYGDADAVIGQASEYINKQFSVITKTRSFDKLSKKKAVNLLRKDFDDSCYKLKNNHIHGVLFHDADDLLSNKGSALYAQLHKLKNEYGSLNIGVSVYNTNQLHKILSQFDVDIVQLPLNIFDHRFVPIIPKLINKGIEVHARSIFLQGVLLAPYKAPKFFGSYNVIFEKYRSILEKSKLTPLEACLFFAKKYSENLVLGVSCLLELRQIIYNYEKCFDSYPVDIFDVFKKVPESLVDPRKWEVK